MDAAGRPALLRRKHAYLRRAADDGARAFAEDDRTEIDTVVGVMDVISTADVPARERFAFWREVSSKIWVPYDLRCEPHLESGFQARIDVGGPGPVQATLMTTTPYTIHRTARLIRRADPELCKLAVAVHGTGVVAQGDRHAEFRVGDLVLYDTSRPYSATLATDIPASQLLVLQFARSALPLPPRDLRRLTAVRIPGDQGVGALSSQFLLQLARHLHELGPADTARLAGLTLDVLTAALANALDVRSAVPPTPDSVRCRQGSTPSSGRTWAIRA